VRYLAGLGVEETAEVTGVASARSSASGAWPKPGSRMNSTEDDQVTPAQSNQVKPLFQQALELIDLLPTVGLAS